MKLRNKTHISMSNVHLITLNILKILNLCTIVRICTMQREQ